MWWAFSNPRQDILGYAENRGNYYRGRYKIAPGRYGTVCDAAGATIKFRTKREAEQAANDEEAKVRAGTWRNPSAGQVLFGTYVSSWYADLDLAASTMETYRGDIEHHLLPEFEKKALDEITGTAIAAWERREKTAGYAPKSIKNWRALLHLILQDAHDEELIKANPAAKRRGRGKRAGRASHRAPEKAITDPLGALLIAERAALLAGRDDEFVACVLMAYTGMRWGEVVGLEEEFVRSGTIRIEWQLYQLDTGELHRCPPKDDSYRTIDSPAFLSTLLTDHMRRTRPRSCPCHGRAYVFRGLGAANGAARKLGVTMVDLAQRAGVSPTTVSTFLNRPDAVAPQTRIRIEAAVTDLGYVRGGPSGESAPHWRRNGFATWLFQPATTGWYPRKGRYEARPVPICADRWPGVPVRGRNASGRADACWSPIAPGLTPHGLRHTHKTRMRELRTPPKLMDERLGHDDGSVQGRYDHVTPGMRARLMDGLTTEWEAALNARLAMCATSPVRVLNELLQARTEADDPVP